MSFKNYLNSKKELEKLKGAVFTFGRFNPITKGHAENVNFLKDKAKKLKATPLLYTSQSQNAKKNPLKFEDKVHYLEKFFNLNVPKNKALKNAFQILEDLAKQGYERVYFIVGEDRVNDFQAMKKYAKDWGIKHFEIIESGKRTKGVSGSDMRNYVKAGDFESFKKNLPAKATNKDAEDLYALVHTGLDLD